jgi:hypothetical protein
MTRTLRITALAAALAAASGLAWSQPSTTAAPKSTLPSSNSIMSGTTSTSSDPYDPSNTQLRSQCFDAASGTWRHTPECASLTRNGIPPDVIGGGTPATAGGTTSLNANTMGSTSSLNSNSAMSGSTTRSTTSANSSLSNPSMSSSGVAGTGATSSTAGNGSTAGTGSTGATAGGSTGAGGGH